MGKKIIVHTPQVEESPKDTKIQQSHAGEYFMRFLESQKKKKRGLTEEGAKDVYEKTIEILDHCNPHDATGSDEVTHLVVGYVQSGKTMSFTGLTALAKDNGYRVVIYLAGTKENLVNQTADRLTKDLLKRTPENHGSFRIHRSPSLNNRSEIEGHLKLSDKPILLIPILKHQKHIENVRLVFAHPDIKHLMKNETVLIIDDEADQASLNGYGHSNSIKDEIRESRIYGEILALRAELPGNSYVQYTATPQANLLIGMQDLLSPRSHTLLNPGEGYVGGKLYFGQGKNHELFQGKLIRNIPQNEVLIRKKQEPKKLPKSLRDALMLHVLSTAIVVKYLKVEDIYFLSMMVHIDQTKKWSKIYKRWIDNEFGRWSSFLSKPDGHEDKEELYKQFENIFPMAVEFYEESEGITFDKIKPFISDIINDKKIYLVNTDVDAETDIAWDSCAMHILVGAQMLDRGFTIENLATTYMPRYSQTVTNSDTIQQRCRFFGYKMPYIRSCRVFLPSISIQYYLEYVKMEEELRSVLASCDSLVSAERKLLLSDDKLRPTRQNVLPISVVKSRLTGLHLTNAFNDAKLIRHNDSVIEEFLFAHKAHLNDITFDGSAETYRHRGFKVPVKEAIEFLSNFQYRHYEDVMRKAATIRYLRYLSSLDSEDAISFVYFIEMAYSMKKPRERALDPTLHKLTGNIYEGYNKNYVGDQKIVMPDSITIQLYDVMFKNPQTIGFPDRAYTLAFNYPNKLQAVYYSAESKYQDDSIDEED